ncbi:MAG: amidohydrolase [Bacteroidales bacterium]|nr:amidohydrolase [Bacteroidales bacterium]
MRRLFFFILMISMFSCSKTKVDLIVHNANVYTVDSQFSKATAFAVDDGKFVAVGSDRKIFSHYYASKTLDAQGQSIYPGFIDGHCHFVGYGETKVRYADLNGCQSFEEVLDRLAKHDENNDSEWLLGRGWDQNLWEVKEFPTNAELNKRFPDKKVLITRVDGHAVLVSDNVLNVIGLDEKFSIDGGEVLLNNDGKPSGILLDNAADMAKAIVPPLDNTQRINALKIAQRDCFAHGLTGVTDAGLDIRSIALIDSLQTEGVLKMKVNAMINPDDETMDYFMKFGVIEKERLTVSSVKIYADGALGSRGAKLLEPYSDAPETSGLLVEDESFYDHVCEKAYNAGYQVCCHAIGDGGVRMILNEYAKFLKGKNDLRWRVEHSQVVDPQDFALYKEYSIIPSIQATHCTSDMPWAEERLGSERVQSAYAYKTLLEQNGWLINGTDFPIEHISPIKTFYSSVARKDLIENRLTREEALKSMTIWAAKGYFAEGRKGSIEVGKEADFVILSDDIMTIDDEKIPEVKVMNTFINGEMVY